MDEEEDEKILVQGVPFIAAKDFLMKYGKLYEIRRSAEGKVELIFVDGVSPAESSCN